MFQFPLGFLRLFSLLDGLSFVVLLYFAIYEKRILGDATAVRVPGMIHGVIFTIFLILLYVAWERKKIPLSLTVMTFLCSLVPFAPFFLEGKLKKQQSQSS